MKGRHHIILETAHLKYEFELRRNITVILGDSATGKTTRVEMLSEYSRQGGDRGIRLASDVPCEVYTGTSERWQYTLDGIRDSVVIIDEEYSFVHSKEFAEYVQNSGNYYVIITRRPLKNLPYSISEIYGIRTSGKYHFPEQAYHEFYPIYPVRTYAQEDAKVLLLVEDSKAGYQFFDKIVSGGRCTSANGNANIYAKLIEAAPGAGVLVIADGAAFGAYIDQVVKLRELKKHIALYFPESFEWMVLKSGVLEDAEVDEILRHPEDYIDSKEYVSWERFFTALLSRKTEGDKIRQYSKALLPKFYTSGKNAARIVGVMPEEIRRLLS